MLEMLMDMGPHRLPKVLMGGVLDQGVFQDRKAAAHAVVERKLVVRYPDEVEKLVPERVSGPAGSFIDRRTDQNVPR